MKNLKVLKIIANLKELKGDEFENLLNLEEIVISYNIYEDNKKILNESINSKRKEISDKRKK